MAKKIKKVWTTITTILLALVVLFAFLIVGTRFIGFQIYTVLSGSMEPNYKTGSIIYVKEIDPAELEVKDVITFKLNETTIATHRIVEIVPDEDNPSKVCFVTKGDANEVVDGSMVSQDDVVGTPVFTIPYLGYVISYIQHPPGIYITVVVGAFLMLLMILPELIFSDEKEKNEKNNKKLETK